MSKINDVNILLRAASIKSLERTYLKVRPLNKDTIEWLVQYSEKMTNNTSWSLLTPIRILNIRTLTTSPQVWKNQYRVINIDTRGDLIPMSTIKEVGNFFAITHEAFIYLLHVYHQRTAFREKMRTEHYLYNWINRFAETDSEVVDDSDYEKFNLLQELIDADWLSTRLKLSILFFFPQSEIAMEYWVKNWDSGWSWVKPLLHSGGLPEYWAEWMLENPLLDDEVITQCLNYRNEATEMTTADPARLFPLLHEYRIKHEALMPSSATIVPYIPELIKVAEKAFRVANEIPDGIPTDWLGELV